MPILKKEKQETFAVLVASGKDPLYAYVEAVEKPEMTEKTARQGVARWTKLKAIKLRISELRIERRTAEDQEGRKERDFSGEILSREEAEELLSGIAVDKDQKGATRIAAIHRLGEMKSWKAPEEMNQTVVFKTEMPDPNPLPEEYKKE